MTELIQSFGFPVACCLGLALYLKQLTEQQRQDNKEDKERLYTNLDKLNQSNTEVVTTNRMLVEHMQGDIKNIETKVDKIVIKVEQDH
ncbi:hypothetical protein G8V06_09180 [Clostridium botulinum D/C]|uniref:hypothetical protein n=1 Tax=Clostridium botulinum TaxID=1491 RepID=UPI001E46C681|nr:hypothetical protein [Clostridium botulinum]MCD3234265.1 hypothetical protein [Clostridium botulinum D/C]MCD3240323.1 hypothetical protein [Clostridium botulinum D/C]MCD3267684.1 hypothetical protein [Clostridium botulinum D/C]MCD3306155.1 hypothetical protein [Clostridium botulinum D/C]MCD3314865.1 hypothetical protein [Clostridium botulinum D/C]